MADGWEEADRLGNQVEDLRSQLTAAEAELYAKNLVCGEILAIIKVYHEQDARPAGVDTPGGLEHMGDVWRLLMRWEGMLQGSEG